MVQNIFAAGSATALLFRGQNLIGIAKALTDSTVDASISAEEVRAASGNLLFGKYFHTSNLSVTLTNALFDMGFLASSLGSTINSGGVSLMEESAIVAVGGTTVTLTKTPVAFGGSIIGWYKLPTATEWTIGTVSGTTMTVAGLVAGDAVCVKYFYNDPNATNFIANAQYVPEILHVVLLIDLFKGSGTQNFDVVSSPKAGRLIIDIPNLQMDGNQNLALTSTGTAAVSLTGSALAVEDATVCSSDPYYGTFTQQLFDTVWQNEVTALAVVNGDVEVAVAGTETLIVKALRTGTLPFVVSPADLTYTVTTGGTYATVSALGVVTGSSAGEAVIKIELKDGPVTLDPGIANVTVS